MAETPTPSLSISSLDASIARMPLHEMTDQLNAASSPDVTLETVEEFGQINFRADGSNGVLLQNIRKVIGVTLPTKPNSSNTNKHGTALWLGPDEWLILRPLREIEDTIDALQKACKNRHTAITDVTDNRTILRLSGPSAWQVMQKGCTLDLHRSAWRPNDCAQTLYMRSQIVLIMRDTSPTFWLFVRPSFAIYLAQSLIEAMTEFS